MSSDRHSASAFTLVEVTLAIGVAAFSLLAIFGLLPVGIATNQAAVEQAGADDVLSAVIADLRSTPATTPKGAAATTQHFGVPIPANPLADSPAATNIYVTVEGRLTTAAASDAHYLLSVTFVPNGTAPRAPTFAKLAVSWPAAAGPTRHIGAVEQFLILDRN